MFITIEDHDWNEALYTLAGKALRLGSKPKPTVAGTVYEIYDNKMAQSEFNALLGEPVEIDKSATYVMMPYSQLDNLVTVSMPDSKYIDEEGEEVRRQWQEYAPFFNVNVAGDTVLMRCVHVKYGSKTANGTSDAELRAWLTEFGSIVCKTTYDYFMTTLEWKHEEV